MIIQPFKLEPNTYHMTIPAKSRIIRVGVEGGQVYMWLMYDQTTIDTVNIKYFLVDDRRPFSHVIGQDVYACVGSFPVGEVCWHMFVCGL